MNPLPTQLARHEEWLLAREMDTSLRAKSRPSTRGHHFVKDATGADSRIEVGQIRLLPGWLISPSSSRTICHVAVLTEDSNTPEPSDGQSQPSWNCAIFSPYGQPANIGEFRTALAPLDEPPDISLRVLSLWNRINIPSEVLSLSWIVGALPDADVEAARKIYGSSPAVLEPELAARCGPPAGWIGCGMFAVAGYMREEEALASGIEKRIAGSLRRQAATETSMQRWREFFSKPKLGTVEAGVREFAAFAAQISTAFSRKTTRHDTMPANLVFQAKATDYLASNPPALKMDAQGHLQILWSADSDSDFGDDVTLPAQSRVLLMDGSTGNLLGEGEKVGNDLSVVLKKAAPPPEGVRLIFCKSGLRADHKKK